MVPISTGTVQKRVLKRVKRIINQFLRLVLFLCVTLQSSSLHSFCPYSKTQRARGLKSKCGLIGDAEGRKKNSFPCKAKLRTCGHLTEKKKNLSLVSCTQHVFIYQTGSRANEKINSTDKQPLCPQCVTVNPYGHSRGAAAKTCHTRGKGSSLKPNVPRLRDKKAAFAFVPPESLNSAVRLRL